MGLSSKLVSSDGLDWSKTLLQAPPLEPPKPPVLRRQHLQNSPAAEQLKCPRCDSMNTKFCYYNNYNKSQPRHFCKTCKRHWTKGGTLRNVPVGGGRKNKRLKASKTTPKTAATTAAKSSIASTNGSIINRVNPQMLIQAQKQKNTSEITSQPLIAQPAPVFQQNFAAGNDQNSIFFGSNFQFPYSSSNFETNPSSISSSFQTPNVYNFGSGEKMEDSILTGISSNTCSALMAQPWEGPNSSCWNWDDLDSFAPSDLNIQWDDSELKP